MANFYVRIELHQKAKDELIPAGTYDKLHEAMKAAKFFLSVRGSDDSIWKLPTATYHRRDDSTVEDVRALVKTTVRPIWNRASILVIQAETSAWSTLTP